MPGIELSKGSFEDKMDLARDPATSSEVLSVLAEDGDSAIRECVAMNPAAPEDVLAKLSADPDSNVRIQVARHANTPPDAVIRLAHDPVRIVRFYIMIERIDTPRAALEVIAREPGQLGDLAKHMLEDLPHADDAEDSDPEPPSGVREDPPFEFKTDLARRMWELRQQNIMDGARLMSADEISEEVARRRGQRT